VRLDLDPETAMHVGFAVRAYLRAEEHNGRTPRPAVALAELAAALTVERMTAAERHRAEHVRALTRERNRKWRAKRAARLPA
jgi:hypothetical protein